MGHTAKPQGYYYNEMRSRVDNAIIDLLLRARSNEQARKHGLKIRQMRYVFGGYSPKDKEEFRWLDFYRKEQLKLGLIDSGFKKYKCPLIWNHCNKLCKMGIMMKDGSAYKLIGINHILGLSRLPYLRRRLKKARQEDCRSSPLITLVDAKKFLDQGFQADELNSWFIDGMTQEAERIFSKASSVWKRIKDKGAEDPVFPLCVIDLNSLTELRKLESMRFG